MSMKALSLRWVVPPGFKQRTLIRGGMGLDTPGFLGSRPRPLAPEAQEQLVRGANCLEAGMERGDGWPWPEGFRTHAEEGGSASATGMTALA